MEIPIVRSLAGSLRYTSHMLTRNLDPQRRGVDAGQKLTQPSALGAVGLPQHAAVMEPPRRIPSAVRTINTTPAAACWAERLAAPST